MRITQINPGTYIRAIDTYNKLAKPMPDKVHNPAVEVTISAEAKRLNEAIKEQTESQALTNN